MKTYKYTVESYFNYNELPHNLNNMGKQGWRVVSIIHNTDRSSGTEISVVYEKEKEEEKVKPTNDQSNRTESMGKCECETSHYPQDLNDNEDGPLYYVEFHKWSTEIKTNWTLFQRRFICSKEGWEKTEHNPLESRELHPWNLGGGVLNDRKHAMDMNTKNFLIFMVDALNEKVKRSSPGKFDPNDFGETSGGF